MTKIDPKIMRDANFFNNSNKMYIFTTTNHTKRVMKTF